MDKDYVNELEKRCEQLQDIVSTFQPTTLNMMTWMLSAKKEQLYKNKIRWNYNGMSRLMLLREICTITFNFGRQSGHSTAIETIRSTDPSQHILIVPIRAMTIANTNAICLDKFEHTQPASIDAKLILADNFLVGEYRYIERLYTILTKSFVINNETPPIIIIT